MTKAELQSNDEKQTVPEKKKMTVIDYLRENCICDPNSNRYLSTCGFPCCARWHWLDELRRIQLKTSLAWKFDPTEVLRKLKDYEKE